MPNERWEQVAELVKSAVALEPEHWSAFLDQECDSDPTMRAEIESLLAQQEGASRFIESSALHLAAASLVGEGACHAGQVIGDYEIVSLIGKGGMGEVYLARDRKLGRKAALKLILRGLDSENLIRHFKREESLLASLNHPNIAQLYGGGVTEDGSPFFAMEYVEGQRLDEFCNERSLTIKARLEIFRKVCSAVTYAHQHLVIHRDLKPANIRVTPDGEPKLLDFGIAKLLDPEANLPELTITLGAVMTPEYASPEQVCGESMTTASDTYSLGVVLYELLTGVKPYNLTSRSPYEISQAITDQEPTRPSLVTHQATLVTDRKSLRGDLDNIVLKALRKEPERRYSSVGQFSEDIRRHLAGLPVIARKDTFYYRSGKFIRRNRLGVLAAVLVLLSLLAGILTTTWQKRKAERRFNDVEKLANSLLVDILPKFAGSPGTSEAREILVKRAIEYFDSLAQEVGHEPRLERELAVAYRSLGEENEAATGNYPESFRSYRKALVLDEDLVKVDPANEMARDELARDYERAGASLCWSRDTEGAFGYFEKAMAVRMPLLANNPQSFDFRFRLAHLHLARADLFKNVGELKEANQSYRLAMELLSNLLKDESPERELKVQMAITWCHNGLAESLAAEGELSAAEEEYEEALALAEPLYTQTPHNPNFRSLLAAGLAGQARIACDQGNYEEALNKTRRRLALWEGTAKSGDVMSREPVASAYSDLGLALSKVHDFSNALDYLQRAIVIQEDFLAHGVTNSDYTANLASSYERLGVTQKNLSDYSSASDSYGKALLLREQNAIDKRNATAQFDLAACCDQLGQLQATRSQLRRSRNILQGLRERYPERNSFARKLEEVEQHIEELGETSAELPSTH